METILPLFDDVSLKFASDPKSGGEYPTARLQKGWLLCKAGVELSEEAVGFGVPILNCGETTIFPGSVELEVRRLPGGSEILAEYRLDLEERIAGNGPRITRGDFALGLKNKFSLIYKNSPCLRPAITALSSGLRRLFRLRTEYETSRMAAYVLVRYQGGGERGVMRVETDLMRIPDGITEAVLMNEQGGRHFNRYRDSGGTELKGGSIGGWDAVRADEASFLSDRQRLSFTLKRIPGARLFRGRELVGRRLAWSGFGYVFPPELRTFDFEIRVGAAA